MPRTTHAADDRRLWIFRAPTLARVGGGFFAPGKGIDGEGAGEMT